MNIDDQLMEKLAAAQHEIWAHWMRYQFSSMWANANGALVLDDEYVKRWQRQSNTPYGVLSEGEKQSNRDIVARFLNDIVMQAIKRTAKLCTI